MKKLKLFNLVFLSLLILISNRLLAQASCTVQSTLIVSTGYNPTTGNTIPVGTGDPMWTLIQAPPSTTGPQPTIPAPAFRIGQPSAWDATPGPSAYINAFPSINSISDNWLTPVGTEYIYERLFCICTENGVSTKVQFDLSLHADNWAEVYVIDANGTTTLLLSQPFNYTTANFTNPPESISLPVTLSSGTHRLQIHARNRDVYMGVSLYGEITSPSLLADSVCSPFGNIVGIKYSDVDNNGVISAADTVVPGWGMNLYDNNGILQGTAITDINGLYIFSNLIPGEYTVVEDSNPDWTMVSHPTGEQNVTVVVNSSHQANFLNIPNSLVGHISGFKYSDVDNDGVISAADTVVPGWPITLLDNLGNQVQATTDINGFYSFPNLIPGLYTVEEDSDPNWTMVSHPTGVQSVTVLGNVTHQIDFLNIPNGSIQGFKYSDVDNDGMISGSDTVVPGWQIELSDINGNTTTTFTNANGNFIFPNLTPGIYSVTETPVNGWAFVNPSSGTQNVTVLSNNISTANFLNGVPCSDLSSLTVSTGYNPQTQSPLSISVFDPMWRLVQHPGTVILNQTPAFTVSTHSSWAPSQPNSTYISPTNTGYFLDTNNGVFNTAPYIYERDFCICNANGDSVLINFNLTVSADNWAEISCIDANGTQTILFTHTVTSSLTNFTSFSPMTIGSLLVPPGTQTIRIETTNLGGPSGVNLSGQITSNNAILSDNDCNPTGDIIGQKFSDFYNFGTVISHADSVLSGWLIRLIDPNTNAVIDSTLTDVNGYYSFLDLQPGNYHVQEFNDTNWVMVNPSNGINQVVVTSNSVTRADFLNRKKCRCDTLTTGFTYVTSDNCTFFFEMGSPPAGIDPCIQMEREWNITDQNGSIIYSQTHTPNILFTFPDTGVYFVCLEISDPNIPGCTFSSCEPISSLCSPQCSNFDDSNIGNYSCGVQNGAVVINFQIPLTNVNAGGACQSGYLYSLIPPFGSISIASPASLSQNNLISGQWNTGLTNFTNTNINNTCFEIEVFNPCDNTSCIQDICYQLPHCAIPPSPMPIGGGEFESFSENERRPEYGISIAPNPNNGRFFIDIFTEEETKVHVQISQVNGIEVYNTSFISDIGNNSHELSASLKTGLYYCIITVNNEKTVMKLVISD